MRLSAQMVKEAFETTRLSPIQKDFKNDGGGCGMEAYARSVDSNVGMQVLKVFGRPYFEGFTTGWDGYDPLPEDRLLTQYGGTQGMFRYLDGLEDGRAAYGAVIAEDRTLVGVS